MKKTIRNRVWEPTSSSMHSIAVDSSYLKDAPGIDSVEFKRGEFGWSVNEYFFVDELASYLYEAVLGFYWDDPDQVKRHLEWIENILNKYHITAIFYDKNKDYGYIDHSGELGDFLDYIFENEDHLLSYLFGKSAIFTTNDNRDENIEYHKFCEEYESKPNFIVFHKYN